MSVNDSDLGWERIMASILALDGATLEVGIQADEDSDFLKVAAVQEFGSEDGRIPERSYLRATMDESVAEIDQAIGITYDRVIAGVDPLVQVSRLGELLQSLVKKRIKSRIDPANAESTIKRKSRTSIRPGDPLPLVDKGRLWNSIRYKATVGGALFLSEHTNDAPAG